MAFMAGHTYVHAEGGAINGVRNESSIASARTKTRRGSRTDLLAFQRCETNAIGTQNMQDNVYN